MFSSLSWGQSQFDEEVDKATSELRLAEEDIALNLEICDQIRSKAVPPKNAARALRRRLAHRNPNVQLLTLSLTDVCVKNGGDHFLAEVASKEFIDNIVSLLIANPNPDVRSRILRLIQNWAVAFEGKPALSYVAHAYHDLQNRGFDFPPKDPALANAAMVDTSTAPEWIDSDVCMRCRTPFSFTNRKHHCRNCGQVFDQQCSARTLPLPHFGIPQEVRVCDSCHTKLSTRREKKERSQSVDFHTGHHHRSSRHRHRDVADADLQRAIQLSLAESGGGSSTWRSSEPPLVDRTSRPAPALAATDEDDPELRAAIEASLREIRAPRPSAPAAEPDPDPVHYTSAPAYGVPPPLPVLPRHDLHPREEDAILTFNQTLQDEPGAARRDLARAHALYDQASGLRPKLALSLDDAGRKEQMLGEMHEKLSHAVKLYDQLLTEQLARPVWQRGASVSRAGTWHAGVDSVRRGSVYREEAHQEPPYQTHQPPDAYQSQQQYQPLPQQPYQPSQQAAQPEPYQAQVQQSPQSYQAQSQPSSQSYQAQPSSQPYQAQPSSQPQPQPSQAYQPQPSQSYQPQPSHPQSSQSYQPQPSQPQPSQSYQPQPSQPYQQFSQTYSAQPSQLHLEHQSQPHHQQTPAPVSPWPAYEPPTPVQQQLPTPAHHQATHEQYHLPQHAAPSQPQYIAAPPAPTPQQYAPQAAPASQQYAAPPAPVPVQSPSYFQPVQSPPPAQPVHSPPIQSPPPVPVHSPPPTTATHPYYHTMFPTVPTSNPQTFPLYASGPGPLEHTEKKEVALIDL